jgi:hypothetical protein
MVHDHGHEGVLTVKEGGIGDALFTELRERPSILASLTLWFRCSSILKS